MVLINLSSCSLFYTTQDTPRRVDAIPLFGVKIDKSSTHGAFCVMDTTIWKEIPGYEGYYEASDTGLIRSSRKTKVAFGETLSDTSKVLRPAFDKDCYLRLVLSIENNQSHFLIHQLVALTFIPNPENKPYVDHINGVRWDNRAENLRWVTQSENQQFAYDYGRKLKNGRSVDQFDLNGNFIKRYRVINDVEKDGYCHQSINKVVLGTRKTAYGFIWKYVEVNDAA